MRIDVYSVDFHFSHKAGNGPSQQVLVGAESQSAATKIAEAEFGSDASRFEVEHVGTVTRGVFVPDPPKPAAKKVAKEQTDKVQ